MLLVSSLPRVSAPDIETMILARLRQHIGGAATYELLIANHLRRVVVGKNQIDIHVGPDALPDAAADVLTVTWRPPCRDRRFRGLERAVCAHVAATRVSGSGSDRGGIGRANSGTMGSLSAAGRVPCSLVQPGDRPWPGIGAGLGGKRAVLHSHANLAPACRSVPLWNTHFAPGEMADSDPLRRRAVGPARLSRESRRG